MLNIKKENFIEFINLANIGINDESNKENNNKKINYQNFLKNLCNFKYGQNNKIKNIKQSNNDESVLPRIT